MSDQPEDEEPEEGSIWPLLGWVIFALSMAILAVAVMTGVVLRSVVLDVASFWPGWVAAVIVGAVMWPRSRKGASRVGAIAPLLLFSFLTWAVGLHYSGWDQLPSAAGHLAGPQVGEVTTAELTINVTGEIRLIPGSDHLYEVELIKSGGATGPAEALERASDNDFVVRLVERPDAGWFSSDGWNVYIARSPSWSLSVSAARVDLDLATISVTALDLVADGEVRLASPAGEVPVSINGSILVEIPASTSVEVIGSATVPDDWERTDAGWSFTGEGTASYVITVGPGATLVVTQW